MDEKVKGRIKSVAVTVFGAVPGIVWYFNGGGTPSIIVAILVAFIAFAFTLPEVSAGRVARGTAAFMVARNVPSVLQDQVFDAIMGDSAQAGGVANASSQPRSDDPQAFLDWLAGLSPYERSTEIGYGRARVVFASIESEEAMQWLERHLDSPVVPAWGNLLFERNPSWARLAEWIQRSKLHALAAIDALLAFSGGDYVADPRPPRLPDGATCLAIEETLQFAADAYGNPPRMREAIRKLRHVWPVGDVERNSIEIPDSLLALAAELFGDDQTMVDRWRDSMVTALDPPEGAVGIAEALMHFADEQRFIAILDWKAGMEEIVGRLRDLPISRDVSFELGESVNEESPTDEVLKAIGAKLPEQGLRLVAIDHGADDYPLAMMAEDRISRIEKILETLPAGLRVVRF